eukprot:scaffold44312_cov45-Phaeocystis_antarctica.AAC.2
MARRVAAHRGSLRVALAALCVRCRSPMIPLRRPSRRVLRDNDLSGSVPPQLGNLTALTVGGGRARRVWRHVGKACASHLPPSAFVTDSPMIPLRRPSRRSLRDNSLGGSLPSQLGRLAALTDL